MKNEIKIFEQNNIRSIYDEENEKWFFSVVDLIAVLTESKEPRKYWSVLKTRLKKEGSELTTICSQLKMKNKMNWSQFATANVNFYYKVSYSCHLNA